MHSYANRRSKGTHRAVDQLQKWARHFRYALRMDIVQHFPSVDHALLRRAIAQVVRDDDALWLVDRILESGAGVLKNEYTVVYFPDDNIFSPIRPRGLPIGSLTSQFWSNVYMNDLDWFITAQLRCSADLRYVDDFTLFSDSKEKLYTCLISFAELDASVKGWVNHVRYADTWGLRTHIFNAHPVHTPEPPDFKKIDSPDGENTRARR